MNHSMTSFTPDRRWLTLACGSALLATTACGGGGGGSSSQAGKVLQETAASNDSPAQAQSFGLNRDCVGSLNTLGDVDFWSVKLTQGDLVRVELFGSRMDQPQWRTNLTLPRVRITAPDALTEVAFHDFSGASATTGPWSHGKHDLDIAAWRVPASGRYYLSFESDDGAVAGGGYAFRVQRISGGNNTLEAEVANNNDTPATAEPLPLGNLAGISVAGEDDYYSFALTQTTLVNFDVVAERNGVAGGELAYVDMALSLFASDGTTLLRTSDDIYFGDPALFQMLPAGSYFLNVSSSGGGGSAPYVLRTTHTPLDSPVIESESNDTSGTADAVSYGATIAGVLQDPADVDFYSFSGAPGEMVRIWLWDESNSSLPTVLDDVVVDLIGVNGTTVLPVGGQGELEVATCILTTAGTHFVRITPDGTPTATLYHLRIERFMTGSFEVEPNSTSATASKLNANGRGAGIISTLNDVDSFEFKLKKNRLAVVSVYAGTIGAQSDGYPDFSGFGSDTQPLLYIKNESGAILASTSTGNIVTVGTEGVADGLPVASVTFVAPASGKYYAEMNSAELGNGPTHYYIVEVK